MVSTNVGLASSAKREIVRERLNGRLRQEGRQRQYGHLIFEWHRLSWKLTKNLRFEQVFSGG